MKITNDQTVALKLKLKNAKVAGGPDIDREATASAAVGVPTNRNIGNENFIFKDVLTRKAKVYSLNKKV